MGSFWLFMSLRPFGDHLGPELKTKISNLVFGLQKGLSGDTRSRNFLNAEWSSWSSPSLLTLTKCLLELTTALWASLRAHWAHQVVAGVHWTDLLMLSLGGLFTGALKALSGANKAIKKNFSCFCFVFWTLNIENFKQQVN